MGSWKAGRMIAWRKRLTSRNTSNGLKNFADRPQFVPSSFGQKKTSLSSLPQVFHQISKHCYDCKTVWYAVQTISFLLCHTALSDHKAGVSQVFGKFYLVSHLYSLRAYGHTMESVYFGNFCKLNFLFSALQKLKLDKCGKKRFLYFYLTLLIFENFRFFFLRGIPWYLLVFESKGKLLIRLTSANRLCNTQFVLYTIRYVALWVHYTSHCFSRHKRISMNHSSSYKLWLPLELL